MTRTGTETRQRSLVITTRFSEQEAQTLRAMADKSGLTVGALIRHAVLNVDPPRASRRPSVELQAAARVLAALGKIGSNVNQLAHYAHLGRFQSNSIDMALRDLAELRIACLKALGQERDDPRGDEPENEGPT